MNTARIEPWGIRLSTPATWGECSGALYVRLLRALRLPDVALQKVVITMLLLRPSIFCPRLWWVWWLRLNGSHRAQLGQLAEPFLAPAPDGTTVVQRLPVRRFGIRMARLHAVRPDLLNELDIYSWTTADTLFNQWRVSKDLEMLHRMVCVLYVRPGTTREDRLHGASLDDVKRVPVPWLRAVAAQWSMNRMVVETRCPHLFRQKKEKGKSATWGEVLLGSSGGRFGPYDRTCLAPAMPFLITENQRICDAKNAAHAAKRTKR